MGQILRRQRRAARAAALLVAILAAAAWLPGGAGTLPRQAVAQPAAPDQPPAVIVAEARLVPVTAPAEFIGRVEAVRELELRARVQGFITEIAFQEGSAVEEGQLLFALDPAQFEAELAAVEARQFRARANLEEAQRSLGRFQELLRSNAAPQARVDEALAQFRGAQADILAAEAELRLARLNLSYTRIEASIPGRIGRALRHQGALVGPESGALARIVQLDPIRVVFSLTEAELVAFRQRRAAEAATEPNGGRDYVFRLRLPNGAEYGAEGRLDFVDSEVAPGTGTVAVRVLYDNPDGLLLPGQFVTLVAEERAPERLPLAPFSAVQRDRRGAFIYVLDEAAGRVAQRRIETGARLARGWAVTAGLAAGEVLIVQGTQRLRDGAPVRAVPAEEEAAAARDPAPGPVRESRR